MFEDTLSGSIGPSTFNIGTNGDDQLFLRFFFFTVMKETLFDMCTGSWTQNGSGSCGEKLRACQKQNPDSPGYQVLQYLNHSE